MYHIQGPTLAIVDACSLSSPNLWHALPFKPLQLIDWIIQFREGIGILFGHDKEFETVGEAWIFWIFLANGDTATG